MRTTLTLFVASFCLFGCGESEQSIAEDSADPNAAIIYWDSANPIQWSDFRKPIGNTAKGIFALSGIWSDLFLEKGNQSVIVHAVFSRDSSFAGAALRNDANLHFQRKYFDITEYYARQLRKAVYYWPGPGDLDAFVKRSQDSIIPLMNNFQDIYEAETAFGANPVTQKIWDIKIDSMLRVTDSFAAATVRIELNRGYYLKE